MKMAEFSTVMMKTAGYLVSLVPSRKLLWLGITFTQKFHVMIIE